MKSRAGRLALLVLFVVALGVTAYLFWTSAAAAGSERSARSDFQEGSRAAERGVLTIRAAQQAYVAAGQSGDFWAPKVTAALNDVRAKIAALRSAAASGGAQSELDAAAGSLQDFGQMDGRAREYERTGQNLLAADLIFSNGIELTDAALAAIDRATAAEVAYRATAAETFQRRGTFALAAAAGAAALAMLLLLPRVEVDVPVPIRVEPQRFAGREPAMPALDDPADVLNTQAEGWTPPKRASKVAPAQPAPAEPLPATTAPPPATPAVARNAPDAPPDPAATPMPALPPAVNFNAVAVLCTELSRVDDTMALPPLLGRAAALLDAVGIILWIADPDARELNPVLAQGYPQHLINRLGTIGRDAENATAAAFRTGLLQTVLADGVSNGAIAAPLVTCGGCVGVMAAEVKPDSEKQEAKLAAATIVAAQLASLVGPPATRNDNRVEVAGA